MKKSVVYKIKPPCSKGPYTLGLVHTFTNPCPECEENGYQMYEILLKGRFGETGIYCEERKDG